MNATGRVSLFIGGGVAALGTLAWALSRREAQASPARREGYHGDSRDFPNKSAFVSILLPPLTAAGLARGLPQARESAIQIIGLAAVEMAWGKARQFPPFNCNNMQAGTTWKGPVFEGIDTDRKGKKYDAKFRVFDSYESWANDFFRMMFWSNYKAALDALIANQPDWTFKLNTQFKQYAYNASNPERFTTDCVKAWQEALKLAQNLGS